MAIGNLVVEFLGYGTYEGDFVPDADAGGLAADCCEAKARNPRIRLDNGDVVWGGECWWGPEESFRKNMEEYKAMGYEIKEVRIADLREEERKALAERAGEDKNAVT